jgi:hypothetical protein
VTHSNIGQKNYLNAGLIGDGRTPARVAQMGQAAQGLVDRRNQLVAQQGTLTPRAGENYRDALKQREAGTLSKRQLAAMERWEAKNKDKLGGFDPSAGGVGGGGGGQAPAPGPPSNFDPSQIGGVASGVMPTRGSHVRATPGMNQQFSGMVNNLASRNAIGLERDITQQNAMLGQAGQQAQNQDMLAQMGIRVNQASRDAQQKMSQQQMLMSLLR